MSRTTRTGLMRALGAVLMLSASLGFAACGDDEDSADKPAAGVGTQSGLGTERFKALEAVYAAAVPLDELDEDASVREFNKVLGEYGEECDKLAGTDALRTAYRRFCPLVAELREQLTAAGACEDAAQCLEGVSGFRGVLRKFLAEGERYDRVVAQTKLTPACRRALVNPELSYEVMRGYGRAFAYLQRGLTTGSPADARKAEEILKQTDARAEDLPKAKEALADFRSGCD